MPRRGHLGYVWIGQEKGARERDIAGCGHCQKQMDVTPGQSGVSASVDMCRACMRFVCPDCNLALQSGTCTTWERAFEKMEQRAAEDARVRREYGVAK